MYSGSYSGKALGSPLIGAYGECDSMRVSALKPKLSQLRRHAGGITSAVISRDQCDLFGKIAGKINAAIGRR